MRAPAAILLLSIAACAADSSPEDGADDGFPSGKADGVSLSEIETAGVLRVVNELEQSTLVSDVGLGSRPARNIVSHRGSDPFDTLAELDAIPYVGPIALNHIIEYARDNGYFDVPLNPSTIVFDQPIQLEFTKSFERQQIRFTPEVNDEVYFELTPVDPTLYPTSKLVFQLVDLTDGTTATNIEETYLSLGGVHAYRVTDTHEYALEVQIWNYSNPTLTPTRVEVSMRRNLPHLLRAGTGLVEAERDGAVPSNAPYNFSFSISRNICDGDRISLGAHPDIVTTSGPHVDLRTSLVLEVAADGTFSGEQYNDSSRTTTRARGRIVGEQVVLEEYQYGALDTATGTFTWSLFPSSELTATLVREQFLDYDGCLGW